MKRYIGKRGPDGLEVTVNNGCTAHPLGLHLNVANHSPTGFECGYEGSGPAQLALAILCHHLAFTSLLEGVQPQKLALSLHQHFKRDVIAKLPRDADFEISADTVTAWLWANGAFG